MSRENLRRIIALASIEILKSHSLTALNVKRYFLNALPMYNVRKDTTVTYEDIVAAIQIVHNALPQKPVHFWYRRDKPAREQRRKFVLHDMQLSP